LTDAELAHRRQQADDPVLLNKMAQACDITVEQAKGTILYLCDTLAPLSEQERDEFMANIPVVIHMLNQPPGQA
jgi:hypothetical protein